jgi:signal transduction histidine kinase
MLFAVLGVAAMAAESSTLLARFWAVTALADPPERVLEVMRACHRGDPPAESFQNGTRRFDFRNPADLSAPYAGAPPLTANERARLEAGEVRVLVTGWPVGAGTRAHAVLRPDSPCGLLSVTIPTPPILRPQIFAIVGWMMLAAAALALAGAYFFTARPLLRRVGAAARAAEDVGTSRFAIPGGGDWASMALIHRSLARADARIKQDAALLDARARVLAEVQHAAAMLENIDTDAQLRSAILGFNPAPFDLARSVAETQARFGVLGEHLGVAVEAAWPDQPVETVNDPVLFGRVLANLVHNAIRHGGRHVAIELVREGERFVLRISDDGPGLPENVRARLNGVAGSPDTHDAGLSGPSGRGLKIVCALCNRLGVAVKAEDGPGAEGTLIILSGPLTPAGGT